MDKNKNEDEKMTPDLGEGDFAAGKRAEAENRVSRDYGVPPLREPSEEEVTAGDVIEVDEKGVARVPGQDIPEHDQQADPVDPTLRVRVVRVLEISGTADRINEVLADSAVGLGQVKEVGGVIVEETYRQQLKEGDYVVTTVKNKARDGG